jgi:adenylate cyclase
MKLNFGSLTLDLVRLSLFGPAGEIRLRPKSFEVLRYLAERAGQAVTKDELIAAIWPNVTVTEESLTRCISDMTSGTL